MNLFVRITISLRLLWIGLHGLVELSEAILPFLLFVSTELVWQSAHLLWAKKHDSWTLWLLLLLLLLLLLKSRLPSWLALALRRL